LQRLHPRLQRAPVVGTRLSGQISTERLDRAIEVTASLHMIGETPSHV
jgi:hypothetical protein